MLDASHAPLPQPKGDHNTYHLGEIGHHNIVIACLPTGIYGLTSATVVAHPLADVRLGDIVVSKPVGQFPGVIQYDYGKTVADGSFHRTGSFNNPPERLLTAISGLQAKHKMGDSNIGLHLTAAARSRPSMHSSFVYPGESEVILFESSYVHEADQPSCATTCNKTRFVMKDASTRDRLGEELGILCFEMEAAGLMNHFPCLVIRGICDYSDSHKNKQWQDYAAGTAAAYAKELLQASVPSTATPSKRDEIFRIRSKIPISKSVFFGREAELDRVREAFNATQPARQVTVIWGLSGYGKSQLAIEYLTLKDEDYDSILWIGSSSRDANRFWIIVFDGLESLDDFDNIETFDIRDYFPSCKHGHLLLVTTSLDLHLRLAFPGIQVQGVDDQTGADILLRCAGARSQDSATHEVAMTISRKLGGMPLAIEQAGSYLSYGLTSMRDYNKNFQVRFMERTLKTPMRKYVGSYEKGRTLWTTFDMLYEVLSRRRSESARMLRLIAFLGRGAIPFTTIVGKHEDQEGIFQVADGAQQRGHVTLLPSWLIVLRSEPIVLANIVEELEASGFVKFHRKEGDTVIKSLVLHDLARRNILLLNGWQLYDGTQLPEENVIRRQMGRLLVVLDMFLSQIPNAMLQPPDGKHFRLCVSVAPLYARICRYSRRLDIAAQLWAIVIQHRTLSSEEESPCPDSHREELMEAAEIDSMLGNLADAINKYSAVVSSFESSNREADEMCIKAVGLLRASRERLQWLEQDSGRAIAAASTPKNTRHWHSREDYEYDEDEEEKALRAVYENDRQYGLKKAYISAQRLCDYYHLRNRPKKEAEYREVVWKYAEE
ncbi:hypothetical protein BJX62DRAFT_252083 [Aspergillus germanicus]